MPLARGFTQIYTGDGKGKTSAAVGLAVRAAGAGLRVAIIQFLKGRPTAELQVLKAVPEITLRRFGGAAFVRGKPSAGDRAQARAGLAAVRAALNSGVADVVIADEACVAVKLRLIAESEILDLIKDKPRRVELVLTGRGASARLKRAADLVSEVRAVKHYFKRGVKARKGIEY